MKCCGGWKALDLETAIFHRKKIDLPTKQLMALDAKDLIPLVEDEDYQSSQFLSNDFEILDGPGDLRKHLYVDAYSGSKRIFSSRPSNTSTSSDFTLGRLRFSELQIHGRSKHQETLLGCLAKVVRDHKKKATTQLVLVSGVSGTGKTTLTMTLQKPVHRMGGIFAIGKYDLQHQSEPYIGLALACDKIYLHLKPSDSSSPKHEERLEMFRNDLCDSIGDGIEVLSQIAPSIVNLVLLETRRDYSSESESEEFGYGRARHEAKAKLNFVVRQLFRALCKHFGPVILALDDLQWADVASLELLEDLLSDRKNRHLMVVGQYRSEEFDDSSNLAKTLASLQTKCANNGLEITEISTGSIDVEDVNGMILDLLSVDRSPATMELAKICHRRTQGNVFFVLAFLRMLYDKGFLVFNFGAMKWIWDASKIESGTNATTNVVALTHRKMASLQGEHQTLLALASCLGHVFEKSKLAIVAGGMNAAGTFSFDGTVVDRFLSLALDQGFLEGPSGGERCAYRWVHDSIQEAAISLIPEDKIVKFKYDVGKSLLQELDGKALDKDLFVVVGLLNPYSVEVGGLEESEVEVLATLNLAAAKRSMKLSAFASTSRFAKIGISLLPAGHWESYPRLSLKLFTIACEAAAYQVHEEEMKKYGSEVVQQESVALFDKMRVYRANLSFFGLSQGNRANEAVELCLDVLNQLGCTFPKTEIMRTAKLISALMKHKRDLPKRTAEEVAKLPVLTCRRLREIDSILNELGIYAYTAGQTTLSGLCTLKQTSITLKHGMHDDAYNGFCSLAPFFMVAFGDLKGTDQVAQYARFLKERAHGKKNVAGFCMMQGSFLLPWTHHWSTSIKVLTDGFESGMREGELRNGIFCLAVSLVTSLFTGTSLQKLQNDIKSAYQCTNDLNAGMPLKDILTLQRCVEMLLDPSTYDNSSERPLVKQFEESAKNEDFTLAMLYAFQGYIYYVNGDFERCSVLAQATGILLDKLLSYFANMPVLFHQAISLYVHAQTTSSIMKRRRLKALAVKRHNILRGWAKDGCCNVLHYVAMLDAEAAICNGGTIEQVEDLYQKAIVLAARGGFVQDAGVGNERLARFFQQHGEKVEAGRRYEQAVRYYQEWGFTSKVERLGKETNDLISSWSVRTR